MSKDYPQLEIAAAAELREWLAANHDSSAGAWLVTWKKSSDGPHVGYDEFLDELLAYGWIDSQGKSLDDERTQQLITPRKPKSNWSGRNRKRIERLVSEDRMAEPGLRMIELAKQTGTWTALDAVERLEEPADLKAALGADSKARANWDAFPPSTRRAILEWILNAKREATRNKRIAETAEKAAENIRANQWRRPGD
jgi:uncharacterized protein YdeI (YjbR/CyaY-like superfamily)